MKTLTVLSAVLFSMNAQAAKSPIFCVFEDSPGKMSDESSYVIQYTVKGAIDSQEAMMSVKRTEYGVAKVGGKIVIDRSNVRNQNTIDVPYRKFVVSPKNTSSEWKTYVVKNDVNDGYVTAASLTLSNKKVSGVNYGNSYKAVFSLTTQGDESRYTHKVNGLCNIDSI